MTKISINKHAKIKLGERESYFARGVGELGSQLAKYLQIYK